MSPTQRQPVPVRTRFAGATVRHCTLGFASLALVSLCGAQIVPTGNRGSVGLYDPGTLRTFELTFPQSDWWKLLEANYTKEAWLKADLKVDGTLYKDVGVRFRGRSSYIGVRVVNSVKVPFRISMDEFVPGRKLYGQSDIVLNNGFLDPSFMREVISWHVIRRYMPGSRANFAKLVLNGQSWGLYINVEPANKDMLGHWFEGADGNRYKGDRPPAWLGEDLNRYKLGFPLLSKPKQDSYVDLRDMLRTVFHTTTQAAVAIPRAFDMDSATCLLALDLVLNNHDGLLYHNYYFYQDVYHGRHTLLTWDYNMAFSSQDLNVGVGALPMIKSRYWMARYRGQVRRMLENDVSWARIGPLVDRYRALIDDEVQNDPKKLYTYQQFVDNLTKDVRLPMMVLTIPGLRSSIETRTAYLLAQIGETPKLELVAVSSLRPRPYERVHVLVRTVGAIRAQRAFLRHRVRGAFLTTEMYDDGKHGDRGAGDGVFGGWLPGAPTGTHTEFYCEATADYAGESRVGFLYSGDASRPFRVRTMERAGQVLINELLASNQNGIEDEHDDRDDWIELFNPTDRVQDLTGMWLSDTAKHAKWRFPPETKIAPGGTLLVWADGETTQGPLHASFKLSSAGEAVALFATDGKTLVDHVQFGAQRPDVSTGRLDGAGFGWVTFAEPTPRRPNVPFRPVASYSDLDPSRHAMHMTGDPAKIGVGMNVEAANASVSTPVLFLAGMRPAALRIPGVGSLLLAGVFAVRSVMPSSNGKANANFPIPDDDRFIGVRLYAQAFQLSSAGLATSNALGFDVIADA